jgi:hypothetical protein
MWVGGLHKLIVLGPEKPQKAAEDVARRTGMAVATTFNDINKGTGACPPPLPLPPTHIKNDAYQSMRHTNTDTYAGVNPSTDK